MLCVLGTGVECTDGMTRVNDFRNSLAAPRRYQHVTQPLSVLRNNNNKNNDSAHHAVW